MENVSVNQISVFYLGGMFGYRNTEYSFVGRGILIQFSVFILGGTDGRWQLSHEYHETRLKILIIYIIYILYI